MNKKLFIAVFLVFLILLVAFLVLIRGQVGGTTAKAVIQGPDNVTNVTTVTCGWVKLNQEHEFELTYYTWGKKNVNTTFNVPLDFSYIEVKAIGGGIVVICASETNCTYYINGFNCGNIITNASQAKINQVYTFSNECLAAIHEGTNTIGINGEQYTLKKLSLEMKVIPAHC